MSSQSSKVHEVRGVVARAKGQPVSIETVLVPDAGEVLRSVVVL